MPTQPDKSVFPAETIYRMSFEAKIAGWDYLSLTQADAPAVTDTWVWKRGGVTGTTLATLVITSTDTDRETIQKVELS